MPYEFTSDGYSKFSEDILKAEGDQATLTSLLADMQATVTEAIAKQTVDSERVQTVESENDRLRRANMDLFLRVGEQARQQTGEKPRESEDSPPVDTKSYMRQYFESLNKKEKE